ncbi:MAG: hypothetical protein ABSE18_01115 [Minisyncoccia bacterium]|jgi:hypothetical protein
MLDVHGLQLMVSKSLLTTKEQWVALIDARLTMVKPFLNFMPTCELQHVGCVYDGRCLSNLNYQKFIAEGSPGVHIKVEPKPALLSTDGIWERGLTADSSWLPQESCVVLDKLVLWGLVRNGTWLGAWANYSITHYSSWADQGPQSFADLGFLAIRPTTVRELLEKERIPPARIYNMLTSEFHKWFRGYKERFERASDLAKIMEVEDFFVSNRDR